MMIFPDSFRRFAPVFLCVGLAACNKVAKLQPKAPEIVFYRTGSAKPSGIEGLDKKGGPVPPAKLKWSTADAKIASVSETGEVTANAAGETRISAKGGGLEASVTVRVVSLQKIVVSPETANLVGPLGTTVLIEAVPKDPKGARVEGTVHFMSSNPAVATVDAEGTISSKSTGVTTVVASIEGIKAEIPVRVDVRELARIAIHPATAILRPTEKQVFVASAFDAAEQVIPNIPVAWKSSDVVVCTVNPSGLVEGISAGTCIVEASFAGKTAQASVIINSR